MIHISKLDLITSVNQFFSVDKILYVDAMEILRPPAWAKNRLMEENHAFEYKGRLYLPIVLKGSPENLILRLANGINLEPLTGFKSVLFFDGNIAAAIQHRNIYDFSTLYKLGIIDFVDETAFLIERYVKPYSK